MRNVCGVIWCSTASQQRTAELLKPAEKWAKPLLVGVGPVPFPMLQSLFDGLFTPGLQLYWNADFVDHLTDESMALHLRHGSQLPTMLSTMHMYPINGAVHRAGSGDTAFNYRRTKWAEVIVGVDPDPAKKDTIVNWARGYWDAVHPHSAPGAYVNFMMEEGQSRVEATYGPNYGRLQAIKAKYDSGNLFRVNQNIAPAASDRASA